MTNEELKSGNKLIAEFMCVKNDDGTFYAGIDGGYPKGTLHFIDIPINYHLPDDGFDLHKWNSSWSWLMPVVEKIENMTIDNVYINVLLGTHSCVISPHVHPEIMFVEHDTKKIMATWKTIVKFLKWYNER